MRTIIFFILFSFSCFGQDVWVNTSSGGYWRTAPNSTNLDNYSTRGNINPYTGKEGTIAPEYSNNFYIPASTSVYTQPDYSYMKSEFNAMPVYKPVKIYEEVSTIPVNKGGKYFSVTNGKRNYVKQTIRKL